MSLNGLQNATRSDGGPSDVAALELLAHYELAPKGAGELRSGFALLLELGERQVLLEMDVPIDAGSDLSLNFFLPDAVSAAGRTKVSLGCTVLQCRDPEQLHYSARVSRIGDAAKGAIQKLHVELRSGGRA